VRAVRPKQGKQIPRRLKSARDDNNKGLPTAQLKLCPFKALRYRLFQQTVKPAWNDKSGGFVSAHPSATLGLKVRRFKATFACWTAVILLLQILVVPLFGQEDADTGPSFSLTSQRTYLPGEKPEVSVYSHNVNALEFRVYRVNDPVKFFSQMQELHNFGGRAPSMPKQARTWLEKFHAWKHRVWAWVRDFIRAQFSPDSRHKIRLW
jgi:hypothetical protein